MHYASMLAKLAMEYKILKSDHEYIGIHLVATVCFTKSKKAKILILRLLIKVESLFLAHNFSRL